MQIELSVGGTVLMPSGPPSEPGRMHLFVFITDPSEDEVGVLSVALVPLCSVKDRVPSDATCILLLGDHPFIKQDTWVFYGRSVIMAADDLVKGIRSGRIVPKEPFMGDVLNKVKLGVCKSRYTPQRVKLFYQFAL